MNKKRSLRVAVFVGLCAITSVMRAQTQPATTAPAPIIAGQLQAGDLVAVCGDSITEQRLYSMYIEDYLLMCQPTPKVDTAQFGWSGDVTWGFAGRMNNDVLVFKPTVATTCFGMNDGGYGPANPALLAQFRAATTSIVKNFKSGGVRMIVIGSPGAVDSDQFQPNAPGHAATYNDTLAVERDIAREVAAAEGVGFANVHDAMMDAMVKAKAKYGKTYHVGGADGVHPSPNGHLVMAYAFLKALGCEGNIGTITVDLKSNEAQATDGHKVISVKDGAVEIESTRYPFCFTGNDPANPAGTIGIIDFVPFNEELNRYQLVVHNAGAQKLDVTWGNHTETFSAAELEKGINLAAKFAGYNPFATAFTDVQSAIAGQQGFETPAVKSLIHSVPEWISHLPDQAAAVDGLVQGLVKKDATLREAARAKVVPVKHVIKIEAAK
jgi:lysophospholipase L1-like esterase